MGKVTGFGWRSYTLALQGMAELLAEKKSSIMPDKEQ
jgi:3-dehydroquinate dehydratase